MDNCKEIFLEEIVGIDVHPVKDCTFPIPCNIPNITSMSGCILSEATLRLGHEDGMVPAVEGSMTAKCTPARQAPGVVSTIEVSANVEEDTDIIRDLYNKVCLSDHYVVLHLRDGGLRLCYTLPNTWSFQSPVQIQGGQTRSVSISLKAMSEFIPITLK